MGDVLDAVVAAHMVAASDLPLVGWDVALTPGAPGTLRCTAAQPPVGSAPTAMVSSGSLKPARHGWLSSSRDSRKTGLQIQLTADNAS
jgi:hypothetical protein